MAFARHRETLDAALADGSIDEALDGVNENLTRCDYIFLCTPVSYNEEYLTAIRPFLRKDAILTDVGSVKTNIHEAVARMGMEANFIGGHPMAGSEKAVTSIPTIIWWKTLIMSLPPLPCPHRTRWRSLRSWPFPCPPFP